MESPSRIRGALPTALAAAGGAALVGLAEAGRVLLGATFHATGLAQGVLLAAGVGVHGLLGLAPGFLAGLLVARRDRPVRLWAGFLAGLLAMGMGELALALLVDPAGAGGAARGVLVGLAAAAALVGGVLLVQKLPPRRFVPGVLVAVLLLGAWTATGIPRKDPVPAAAAGLPDVLWVTLDTVRADRFSSYGGRVQTASFDRVAREGALFEKAYAQIAVTGPSHGTMLTGVGPWKHGALLNARQVPDDLATLPEVARAAGYDTAAFVSAWVLDGSFGFNRGFSVYDDRFSLVPGVEDLLFSRLLGVARRRMDPDQVVERRADHTVDRALAWLAEERDRPFFLWVHLFDPHGPYTPPAGFDDLFYTGDPRDPAWTSMAQVGEVAPYLEASLRGVTDVRWVVAQYDGEIAWTDLQLGRLLDQVERRGRPDRTLVVVNGDHGESLGEHGVWFDHGADLYAPSTHVPLALRLPGRVPPGTRVADLVELTDIAPTMLTLMGLPVPSTMEGQPALPGAAAPRIMARGLCYDREVNRQERAASGATARWRMVALRGLANLFVRREHPDRADLYFDVTTDPAEEHDLHGVREQEPEGAQLLGLLGEQADRLLAGTEEQATDITDEQRSRLEALGYLDE